MQLPGEVLRGQQVPFARAMRPRLEVAVVDSFEYERDPADAALNGDELQVEETGKYPAQQQIRDLQALLQKEVDRTHGIRRRRAVGGDPLGAEDVADIAAADVEVDGKTGVPCG